MRALLIALILIGLSLTIAEPVQAQAIHCSPVADIPSLQHCVQHAVEHGFIDNPGVARALLVKLDAAQAAVDRGQPAVAIRTLEAFVRAVSAQAGKHIDSEHARHMQMHARLVIQAPEE